LILSQPHSWSKLWALFNSSAKSKATFKYLFASKSWAKTKTTSLILSILISRATWQAKLLRIITVISKLENQYRPLSNTNKTTLARKHQISKVGAILRSKREPREQIVELANTLSKQSNRPNTQKNRTKRRRSPRKKQNILLSSLKK